MNFVVWVQVQLQSLKPKRIPTKIGYMEISSNISLQNKILLPRITKQF